MATKNQEELRLYLENERDRLLAEIAQIDAEGGSSLGYGNHMADDASEAFEQAKDLALRQNMEQVLHQVTESLTRLQEGSYGLCQRCENQIDPARLKALPYAVLCLHCQQRAHS